jgi:HAD superfamily hydrolase (TIGR01490 family)
MSDQQIALFDLDGTITRRDTYLAYLLGFLVRNPGALLRAVGLPAALALYFTGFRDNSWLKKTFLRAVLGGRELRALQAWTEEFLDRLVRRELRPGALAAIAAHRAAGDQLVLVTASLDFYAEPLAHRLGFDAVLCTRTVVDERGRLTGELAGENCYGPTKLARVRALLDGGAIAPPITFYTDHQSDLLLLRFVHRPVAVNPTRRLRRLAAQSGIRVEDWQ